MVAKKAVSWTCTACLRAQARQRVGLVSSPRPFHAATALAGQAQADASKDNATKDDIEKEVGALSRRMAEMAEDTMNTGSASDRRMLKETSGGFSEDLKAELEARIAQTVPPLNQQVVSQATMPSAAGKGTRDQAAAPIWTGQESTIDSSLRMLDDSHKRIRMPARKPTLQGTTANLRPAGKRKVSLQDRLVNARDKTSRYALAQANDMSEAEKEQFRKELKEKFTPGARPMPTTLQGLTSLANERIEDAIARGQFRNIERGKGVNIERDYTASSPFLDTTEYFMNKIIQRQEIVPPWIEKQQELVKLANSFRARLRNDWRRYAARSISSEGGSLQDQVRKARRYALAEEIVNPRPVKTSESASAVDPSGMLTTITIDQRIAAGVAPDEPEVREIKVTEQVAPQAAQAQAGIEVSKAEVAQAQAEPETIAVVTSTIAEPADNTQTIPQPSNSQASQTPANPLAGLSPMPYPFRSPTWESTERAYHTLAIKELNDLARSYNLMAPKIAQKPYYNLDRELKRCYSDIAPQLAETIIERATKRTLRGVEVKMHEKGSVLEKFQGTGHVAHKIRDEPEKRGYGFREFWRDLFSKEDKEGRGNILTRKPVEG